jgi:hypothetical protein
MHTAVVIAVWTILVDALADEHLYALFAALVATGALAASVACQVAVYALKVPVVVGIETVYLNIVVPFCNILYATIVVLTAMHLTGEPQEVAMPKFLSVAVFTTATLKPVVYGVCNLTVAQTFDGNSFALQVHPHWTDIVMTMARFQILAYLLYYL